MDEHQSHEDLVRKVAREYREILDGSEQGIYIYLDDVHKVCNKRFAAMLGYGSADEWARIDESFPDTFVAEKSQKPLITAYYGAMEKKAASTTRVTWKKKSGGTVDRDVILVPIAFEGSILALHFVF
jgi:PAS domain-containing protein